MKALSGNDEWADARKHWAEAGAGSDVGLWWFADDVRQRRPDAAEEEVRIETLRALRPLLSTGALRAVNLLPGGAFQPWSGSVDEQLARIDAQWAALGRPPDIGDIVWFVGPR